MNHCLIAQDTASLISNLFVPVGCYYSSKSFFSKKPDSEKQFRVVMNYHTKLNGDSIAFGSRVEWMDSAGVYSDIREWAADSNSTTAVKVFCFFDGRDVYLHHGEGIFYKMEGLGKYPYTFARRGFAELKNIGTYLLISWPATLAIVAAHSIAENSAMANINRVELYFFNKKNELTKATPEKIAWLLIKDKDFYKDYENERKITTEVMLKYLKKMNERYPDL